MKSKIKSLPTKRILRHRQNGIDNHYQNYHYTPSRIANSYRDYRARPTNIVKIVEPATKVILLTFPLGKEIVTSYELSKFVYSSWGSIYTEYEKNKGKPTRELIHTVGRKVIKHELMSLETDLVWNKIEPLVPHTHKEKTKNMLKEIMRNISEEEISLVENALRSS